MSERDESAVEKLLREVASAPDRNPIDLSGQRVGRFRVSRLVARGGMGVVYEAVDEQLRRPVALKVMAPCYATDADHKRRFLREARFAAQATPHPNIATVYEVGDSEGQLYIAMELVAGETLGVVLDARRLTIPEALRVAEQIGRGLSCAHERGVVHRDLKPDNVMLTREGVVKLLDFGIAKVRDDAAADLAETGLRTQEGVIRGTPAYMSPEQAMGKPLDARTDVFSFGVVLYEMLAGARPFAGSSKMELLAAITRDPPGGLAAAGVTRALESVVLCCLEKGPARRYQTIGEVLEALSRATDPAVAEAMRVAPAAPSFIPTGVQPRAAPKSPVPETSSLSPSTAALGTGRTRPWWWIVTLFACVAGVGAVLGIRSHARVATAAPSAVSGSSGVHAITGLPLPSSSSPGALAAYKRGMQLMHDGARRAAIDEFEAALKLDPSLAAAHLRVALFDFALNLEEDQPAQLDHFKEAVAGRASLSDHDAILLDAMEPAFRRPRQPALAAEKLRAALVRSPDDVDYLLWRALLLFAAGSTEKSTETYERLLALDPGFCMGWARYGLCTADTSPRAEEALHAYDVCVSACPNATLCLTWRATLAANEGRCGEYEGDMQRLLSLEGDEPEFQIGLATALYSRGGSIDAVRLLERRAEGLTPEADRATKLLLRGGTALDELAGDFASASRKLREVHAALEHEMRALPHAIRADEAAQIGFETGRPADAAAAAEDYLRHVDAWRIEGWGYDGPLLAMLSVERLSERLSSVDFSARRDAWLVKARAVDGWNDSGNAGDFWLNGYGYFLDTSEVAQAFESLPEYHRDLDTVFNHTPRKDLAIGRVYLLGGRVDDALTYLKRAASSCEALLEPIPQTQAHYWLGQAFEKKNDTQGACAAYEVVLERWGEAKPRSVTADQARGRMKALQCTNGPAR